MSIDATFWVAISFIIFLGGLIYLKIPQKINEALEIKIKETKNELEEAEKLKDEAKNLLSNYENKLNQATKETLRIMNDAKKENEKNLIDTTEKFYQLIDNKKRMLNEKINQMKQDALKEVKNSSIEISFEAIEKIIKSSIDQKKLDNFFNDSLNEAKKVIKKSTI